MTARKSRKMTDTYGKLFVSDTMISILSHYLLISIYMCTIFISPRLSINRLTFLICMFTAH